MGHIFSLNEYCKKKFNTKKLIRGVYHNNKVICEFASMVTLEITCKNNCNQDKCLKLKENFAYDLSLDYSYKIPREKDFKLSCRYMDKSMAKSNSLFK